MRSSKPYIVDRVEDTTCFQQKYVYPGTEQWEKMVKLISQFIKKKQYMYNGGWAIHHFLKSLGIGLQIYDENDICDITDFDMFGPSPGEDLIALGEYMKAHIPDMTFNVNNGMHPNQYIIMVNFLGAKLVDWIFISPKVFKYIPSVTYEGGVVCLHPMVELLRQYNMLSNMFLMAPNKDITKALKRITLLEQYAMVPWMKESKLWDARTLKADMFKSYPLKGQKAVDEVVAMQQILLGTWFKEQKYVCKVGHVAFMEHNKFAEATGLLDLLGLESSTGLMGLEFAVHDAVFAKCVSSLLSTIKAFCKDDVAMKQRIVIKLHEPFVGVIGPLYNGWLDCKLDGVTVCKLYSLATPVHVVGGSERVCSYFFNMSHMMWCALYHRYLKHELEAKFYDMMVARTYKSYMRSSRKSRDKTFVLELKKENAVGVVPVRNFYMMNNLMRSQGMGVKYAIDNKTAMKAKPQPQSQPKGKQPIDFKYSYYEGRAIFKQTLDKVKNNALPQLPYLYGRIVSKNDSK